MDLYKFKTENRLLKDEIRVLKDENKLLRQQRDFQKEVDENKLLRQQVAHFSEAGPSKGNYCNYLNEIPQDFLV